MRVGLVVVGAVGLARVVGAQPEVRISVAIEAGDQVFGTGLAERINSVSVSEAGRWLVWVRTDNPDLNTNDAIVRNGTPLVRERVTVVSPPDLVAAGFDSVAIDDDGDITWFFALEPSDPSMNGALFHNTSMVLREGTFSSSGV